QRLIDLVKRVLFLRKQAERKIAIVGVGTGVGLMHAECGGFAAFSARSERVLRDSSHRIDHRVAELEKLVLLLADKRRELALVIIAGKQRTRAFAGFFGGNFSGRLFGGFFRENFFLFGGGHNSKGAPTIGRRKKRRLN